MIALYVVIDTPAYKELTKDGAKQLRNLLGRYSSEVLCILLPYTLAEQYRNVVGKDIRFLVRDLGYRVRIQSMSRNEEERIVNQNKEFLILVNEALRSRKHGAEDDARIIVAACIKAKKCGARKLLVIAFKHHVEHFKSAKNIVEQFLKTEECWFDVEDLETIIKNDKDREYG